MRKLLPLCLFLILFSAVALAAVTLTKPAASAELLRGGAYTYTATTTTDYDNCTFAYMRRGADAYTTVGLNSTVNLSTYTYVSTVPDDFGTYTFKVNCTEDDATTIAGDDSLNAKVYNYDAEEASEASIDIVVGILSTFFKFVSLIVLILLAGWLVSKTKGLRRK